MPINRDVRNRMARAAAGLLINDGPEAITHRKVAEAAGVPLGSSSYWFKSSRELFAAAVTEAENLRADAALALSETSDMGDRSPVHVADLLIHIWYAPQVGPDVVRARLQPMIDALHDPELGAIMALNRSRMLDALSIVLTRAGYDIADVDLVAHVLDSSLIYSASIGDRDPMTSATNVVARLLNLVVNASTVR